MRTYAIGDIHGQLALLQGVHRLISRQTVRRRATGDAPVVHVGDLVDRGPESAGVIGFLIDGAAAGEPWVTLKGNHDRMFRGFLRDPDWHDPRLRPDLWWLHERLGGAETLRSYGIAGAGERTLHELHAEALVKVHGPHVDYLDGLPTYLLRGDVLFVHAGIRPGVDLHAQTEDDFLWIRKEFLEDGRDHGALVIHGHTPVERVTHYGNRVNIDTGAGYGHTLSAVVIEGRAVYLLTEKGRVPVTP